MDDKGQMLILETIFFAGTVLLALLFIYQMSPTAVESSKYTYDLKIMGDCALDTIYNDVIVEEDLPNNHICKMELYLITNSYGGFISDLNNMLPSNVRFNIYIDNGTTTKFWCSSLGKYYNPLLSTNQVTVCHCIVSADFFSYAKWAKNAGMFSGNYKYHSDECDILTLFEGDNSLTTCDVRLEMWYA